MKTARSIACVECGGRAVLRRKDYPFTESGLDNAIIEGLPVYVCKCGEEMPMFPELSSLLKALAVTVARKPEKLNGREFRLLRQSVGMSAVQTAEALGVTKTTVSRWENDHEPIGIGSDKLIRLLCIQTLEEECKKVFQGTVQSISDVKKQRGSNPAPITVERDAWQNYCLA